MNKCRSYVLLLLLLIYITASANALESDQSDHAQSHGSLTLFLENDIFASTDEQFTHGCGVTWMSKEYSSGKKTPLLTSPFFKMLSFLGKTGNNRNYSLSVRQDIYTPKNILDSNLIKDDIPYAGVIFFPIGFYEKGVRSFSFLELDIGLLGPDSYAGQAQEAIHKQLGNKKANGWDNQLKDEIILNLKYIRRWRVYQSNVLGPIQVDILPHMGSGAGNMKTYLNTGTQVRIGWPLPNDFGSDVTQPSCECPASSSNSNTKSDLSEFPNFLIYAFGMVNGQLVFRDIFLDGNTFRDSHRVKKKMLTGDAVVGVGLQVHRLKLSYLYVFQTRIYKTQAQPHRYGSLAVSVLF